MIIDDDDDDDDVTVVRKQESLDNTHEFLFSFETKFADIITDVTNTGNMGTKQLNIRNN